MATTLEEYLKTRQFGSLKYNAWYIYICIYTHACSVIPVGLMLPLHPQLPYTRLSYVPAASGSNLRLRVAMAVKFDHQTC